MDVLGYAQAHTRMPTSPIQHEDDLFVGARAGLQGKGGQLDFEERDANGGGQMEECASRRWVDKTHKVAPFEAMLHRSQRALAVEAPDFVQDRLEPNAMFVDRPQLDLGAWKGGGYRSRKRTELFLKAACSAASACIWRGRGLRRLPCRRTRYAQPR